MKKLTVKSIKEQIKDARGFTLFFAVLVSSVALSIGIAILNVAVKEIILSSSIRDSQFAFYAADAGVECAIYWDIKKDSFSSTTVKQISCDNQTFNVSQVNNTIDKITFSPEGYCSVTTVTKNGADTKVEARGYNNCDSDDKRRVERGIVVNY